MSDKDDRIIEWKKNEENARKLADCFNSWDDDDSWPGGFNQGVKFTAEKILERPFTPLICYVAVDGDKYVGYIDVYQHGTYTDTYFVGLLGVSLGYQGKGYGRDLLKKATEFAVKAEQVNCLSLDTWAGNTKSVPSYKRTGYKWVPGTDRVELESYLPLILKSSALKEFFEENDYYSTTKVDIKQQPDKESLENMEVFKYKFENETGDSVEVFIDRYAKYMTGYKTKDGKGEIGAWCIISSHLGYIGYGSADVTWRFMNTTGEPVTIKLSARGNGGVVLEEKNIEITVPAGETVEEKAITSLALNADSNALRKFNPRHETYITSDITLNGKSVQLRTAQKPVKPFKLGSFPEIPFIFNGKKLDHSLQLTNKTTDNVKIRVSLPTINGLETKLESSKDLELLPGVSTSLKISLQVIDESLATDMLKIPVVLEVEEMANAFQEYFFAFLSQGYQVSGHCNPSNPSSEPLFLQNPFVRINISNEPPYAIDRIDNLVTGNYTGFFGPNMDLGSPYEGFMNEWSSQEKECELDVEKDQSTATFIYRAKSKRLPIHLERRIMQEAGLPGVKMIYRLKNLSPDSIEVDFKTGFGTGDSYADIICPLKEGLTIFNTGGVNYPGEIKDPENYFSENWYCQKFSRGMVMGIIWENSHLHKVQLEGFTEFDWRKIRLEPDGSVDLGFTIILTAGDWSVIRGHWLRESGNFGKAAPHHGGMKPRNSVGINIRSNEEFHQSMITSSSSDLGIEVTTLGENPVSGKAILKVHAGKANGSFEKIIEVDKATKEKPFCSSISLDTLPALQEPEIIAGELVLETRGRDLVEPVQLLHCPDKTMKTSDLTEVNEREKQFTVNNGILKFNADTAGSINFLNFLNSANDDEDTSKNLLESVFPKRDGILVFFNPFVGGIIPLVKFFGSQELEILSEEKALFKIEILSSEPSPWQGVRARYTSGSENHPGIDVIVDHMTVPGANFIKSRMRLKNNTDEFFILRFGFFSFLKTEGGALPKLERLDKHGFLQERISSDFYKPSRHEQWLQVTTTDQAIKLGFMGDGSELCKMDFYSTGDKIRCTRVYTGHKIKPFGEAEMIQYTFLLKDGQKITDYLFLREKDSSKYSDSGSECIEVMDFPVFYE